MSAAGLCVRKFSGTLAVLNRFPSEQQHESRVKQLQGLTRQVVWVLGCYAMSYTFINTSDVKSGAGDPPLIGLYHVFPIATYVSTVTYLTFKLNKAASLDLK